MAVYLVKAKPVRLAIIQLRERLNTGEIQRMRPFGEELHTALENARIDDDGFAIWEEIDYCVPPLAQEREAVLDHHFREIHVTPVNRGEGWKLIDNLRSLWG